MRRNVDVNVLERFMSTRELADLFAKYDASLIHSRAMHEPSAEDKKIAKAAAEVKSVGKVAKELGLTNGRVAGAIIRTFCFQ